MASSQRISKHQFLTYLTRLEQGQPVNEPRLKRGAQQFGFDIDVLLSKAQREHVKKDACRYIGVDLEVLETWRASLETHHASARVQGASLGDSHNARVSGAMLTLRRRQAPHPVVILVEGDAVHFPRAPAERAIIVENLENFLALEDTLALLPSCGLSDAWQDADILFGSGNSVTNRLFTPLFQRYAEIGCLFDPDPGGVRMFDTLWRRGDLPPLRFLAPADLPDRLHASRRPINKAQRQILASQSASRSPAAPVAQLIRKTGKQLEQETYFLPAAAPPEDAS